MNRILLFLLLISLLACQKTPPPYEQQFQVFGTLVNVVIADQEAEKARHIAWYLAKDLRRLNESWNPYKAGSLGRINKLLRYQERFAYPPSTFELVDKGIRLSKLSDGLFNPAIGELIRLWGFHEDVSENHAPPKESDIKAWLAHKVSMDDLQVDGLYLSSKNAHVLLDFGAYAKGLAVDKCIESLRRMGVENAIVNAGGDLRAIGKKRDRPWRIGIKHPRQNRVMASLEISGDESVFTSGDYERYFEYEGKRYHHILDPRTGYPARDFTSVTIVHKNGATADAAATALFVAGTKDWQRIAKKMGIEQVMLVTANMEIIMTPAMQKRLTFAPDLNMTIKQ